MLKNKYLILLTALLITILLAAGCGNNHDRQETTSSQMKVVATTSLIADIVKTVGGDRVHVTSIIPPASCPGHFDVKPDDMLVLSDARLFMLHNWQGEKFSDDLINSSGNHNLKKVIIDVQGNWMAPPVQIEAIDKIAGVLAAEDPAHADQYEASAAKYKEQVQDTAREQKNRLQTAGANKVNVLVNKTQAGFVKWAGFKVVGTFGRIEDTSPEEMEELINLGRQQNVTLVVDNLQSGKETGIVIAREINCNQVTLSNFPGGLPGTGTWSDSLEKNVDLLLEQLKE